MGFVDKLMALYEGDRLQRVVRCYTLASREEQRARLRAVMALSVELERIKAQSLFATRIGEGAIETVIEGDWKGAEGYAEHRTFQGEGPEIQDASAPLWAVFVETLRTEILLARARETSPLSGTIPSRDRPDRRP